MRSRMKLWRGGLAELIAVLAVAPADEARAAEGSIACVIAWGDNSTGRTMVSGDALSGVIAITAGEIHPAAARLIELFSGGV